MAKATVNNVWSNLEVEKDAYLVEFETSFRNSSQWLEETLESGKRRVYEAAPQLEKRRKTSADGADDSSQIPEKENSHPNLVRTGPDSKPSASSSKSTALAEKARGPPRATEKPIEEDEGPNLDVWSMKVRDLRKELRDRNLSSAGLKKELQQRLFDALETEQDDQGPAVQVIDVTEESKSKKVPQVAKATSGRDDRSTQPEEKKALPAPTTQNTAPPIEKESGAASTAMEIDEDMAEKPIHGQDRAKDSTSGCLPDVEMTDARGKANEEVGETGEARQSLSVSVTNELSQLSVSSDDGANDGYPASAVASSKGLSKGEEEQAVEDEVMALNSSVKKKTKLGSVIKATVKMFSPKRAPDQPSPSFAQSLKKAQSKSQLFGAQSLPPSAPREEEVSTAAQSAKGKNGPEKQASAVSISHSQADLESNKSSVAKQARTAGNEDSQRGPASKANPSASKANPTRTAGGAPDGKVQIALPSLPSGSSVKKARVNKPGLMDKANTVGATSEKEKLSGGSTSTSSSASATKGEEMRKKMRMEVAKRKDAAAQRTATGATTSSSTSSSLTTAQQSRHGLTASMTKNASSSRILEEKEKQRARLAEMRGKAREQAKEQANKLQAGPSTQKKAPTTTDDGGKSVAVSRPEPTRTHQTNSHATAAAQLPAEKPSAVVPAQSIPKLNSAQQQKEEKRKQLAAQMRERALAETQKKVAAAASAVNGAQPSKPAVQHDSLATASAPANQSEERTISKATKVSSPMDTYEMSEKEGSDSSSEEESDSDESDDDEQPRKRVPSWAQKSNLAKALEKQYDPKNPGRIDPDVLFGEVQTCNLEEIFGQRKSRYNKRQSTGNWTKDKVTVMEKLTYKRDMGY